MANTSGPTPTPSTNHTPAGGVPSSHTSSEPGRSSGFRDPSTVAGAAAPTGNKANYAAPVHSADHHKLAELIKDVRVAMLVTYPVSGSGVGKPHIRPMYTQKVEPDAFAGELWFMSDAQSSKVAEISANQRVALTYAAPDKNRYIVVHGYADCERNPEKARELWNIHAKGWWPGGPEDPNLLLVRVVVESAEYWDGPSNTGYMISLLKAVIGGKPVELNADHGVVR